MKFLNLTQKVMLRQKLTIFILIKTILLTKDSALCQEIHIQIVSNLEEKYY